MPNLNAGHNVTSIEFHHCPLGLTRPTCHTPACTIHHCSFLCFCLFGFFLNRWRLTLCENIVLAQSETLTRFVFCPGEALWDGSKIQYQTCRRVLALNVWIASLFLFISVQRAAKTFVDLFFFPPPSISPCHSAAALVLEVSPNRQAAAVWRQHKQICHFQPL